MVHASARVLTTNTTQQDWMIRVKSPRLKMMNFVQGGKVPPPPILKARKCAYFCSACAILDTQNCWLFTPAAMLNTHLSHCIYSNYLLNVCNGKVRYAVDNISCTHTYTTESRGWAGMFQAQKHIYSLLGLVPFYMQCLPTFHILLWPVTLYNFGTD